jgi:hypothetical protein
VLDFIESLKASADKTWTIDNFDVSMDEFQECIESAKKKPKLGGWEGKIWMADDFDAPMEELSDCEEFFGPRNIVPNLGSLKGKIWIADDFDAPMEEFDEYM